MGHVGMWSHSYILFELSTLLLNVQIRAKLVLGLKSYPVHVYLANIKQSEAPR